MSHPPHTMTFTEGHTVKVALDDLVEDGGAGGGHVGDWHCGQALPAAAHLLRAHRRLSARIRACHVRLPRSNPNFYQSMPQFLLTEMFPSYSSAIREGDKWSINGKEQALP